MQARGARRQRKAWGGAQRNPRISHAKTFAKPAERGDSVKPGVERSGTPGPAMQKHLQSPRSGRQRWGSADLLTISNNAVNMSDSYTNLLYHIVFSTKDRRPLITSEIEPQLYDYIGGIIRGLGGICLELNGTEDHVHLLAKLRPDCALSDILRELKMDA